MLERPLVEITYRCRDIGYGTEEGQTRGRWGESDFIGKYSFHCTDGTVLYLFPDEVVTEEIVEVSGL